MADERQIARADAAAAKAREKALRPWYRKKRFIIPIALITLVIVASVASSSDDEAEKIGVVGSQEAETTAAEGGAEQRSGQTFKVGDIVKKGNFEAAVLSVNPDFTPTNPYERPGEGKRFVAVELQLKNTGDEAEVISTLLQFKLRDGSNAQHDIAYSGSPDPRFPDGELSAGQTNRGFIPFEVPTAASDMQFVFDANVFGGGRVTWALGI